MINYAINRETKTIELLSGDANIQELRDLIELFKDYKFSISLPFSLPKIENKLEKQGMVVGAKFVPLIGNKDYN
jgi:hypothetical protein